MDWDKCIVKHKIYSTPVANVYPSYLAKVNRKFDTKQYVDNAIYWLTGHTEKSFDTVLGNSTDFETFFTTAPGMDPDRRVITGVICGVRVEDIGEPIIQEIRYLIS